MAVTDPVSDMLSRVRNGLQALHASVNVPKSRMKLALASILKEQGYINEYESADQNINITLKYQNGKPVIAGLKRVSKPGRRVYVGTQDIPRVQNGLGICILSTSRGILDGESAKEQNLGGELLCEIW